MLTVIPATVVMKKISKVLVLMSLVAIGMCFGVMVFAWRLESAGKKARERLFALAYRDEATGLANWAAFREAGDPLLAKDRMYALAVLELCPAFILDEQNGSGLLQRTAALLRAVLLPGELVCRIESLRFALLLKQTDGKQLTSRITELVKHISASAAPWMSVFAGMTLLDHASSSVGEALWCGTMALQTAKSQNMLVAYYEEKMRADAQRSERLARDFDKALTECEILMYLQPKVRLADGRVSGAEALARWQHPQYGFLMPDDFIPLLERMGTVARLDRYLMRAACAFLQGCRKKGLPLYPISLNMSLVDWNDETLADALWEIVREAALPAELIELELPAPAFVEGAACMEKTAAALKAKGFCLALDRFGAGAAQAGMPPCLPLDTVKLDQSLLGTALRDGDYLADLVAALRHCCTTVVGMGIEEEEHAQRFIKAGCNLGQGYYYACPMPESGYERLLKNAERGLPYGENAH